MHTQQTNTEPFDLGEVAEIDLFAESVESRLNATAAGTWSTIGCVSSGGASVCTVSSICSKSTEVLELSDATFVKTINPAE